MTLIQVIWATASKLRPHITETDNVHSVVFETTEVWAEDLDLCEELFKQTNTYSGSLWDSMHPLPEERTHTALSVGDYLIIDERMYRCAMVGWERTDTFIPGLCFLDPLPDE